MVVIVAVFILIGLFCMQHYGTDKVGWLFAPLVLLWFILIGSVGLVNIHKYNSSVLRAYNPVYTFRYFKRGKSEIWTSLGGVMLSITGHWQFNCNLCINCKMKQSYLYAFSIQGLKHCMLIYVTSLYWLFR